VTATDAETFLGLLAAIALLAQLAGRLGLPYPVVLVLGGLALGIVPGLPTPRLDPNVFFFIFLPPLLYSEAFLYSPEAFRAAATEIVLLAVGLVVACTLAVAVAAHAAVGMPWASAFVLGAVVAPTDPVAAMAVIRRLGVPHRIEAILSGESLINDGTALVAYKLAIAAAGAATFSVGHAFALFAWLSLGGMAIGAAVAWLALVARRWITLPEVEITFSLAIPFAAYLPAERLGVSGVLAAVTAGLLIGRRSHLIAAGTRLRRHAFWEVLAFLLESTLFLLIGLTFRDVIRRLGGVAALDLLGQAALLAATVVALRLAWMILMPRVVALLEPGRSAPAPRELAVIGWSGMRGGVSLAAAMSVPVAVAGHALPGRAEIVFFTYVIVLTTLLGCGLTLGPLIRRLGVNEGAEAAEARARAQVLHAALEHIEELADQGALPEEIAERLRDLYLSRFDGTLAADELEDRSPGALSARRGAVAAQREALADLEARHGIAPDLARDIERLLDAEAERCAEPPAGG
jgi:CPA1 family monovalent cation:H+ antiporter